MNANNIVMSLIDRASAPLSNGDELTKAAAWRKTLEQEQMGTLNGIKSVALGSAAPVSQGHHHNNVGIRPLAPSPADNIRPGKFMPGQTDKTVPQAVARNIAGNGLAAKINAAAVPMHAYLSIHEGRSLPSLSETSYASLKSNDAPSTIALFESHYKEKWPFKNIHLMVSADGVRVWIRDTHLSGDDAKAQMLLEKIRTALKADHQELIGLVLNGKAI